MAERKVLQKYYPPDFDPSKLGKGRKRGSGGGSKLATVRMMAPFSMRCTACGEYIYKGKKFNAKKEGAGEKYYNIPVYRFYIRCTRCAAEITFKTDPKNMDYVAERGAARNFEPWREKTDDNEGQEERLDRLVQEELDEDEDAMKRLDAKMADTKREMQIADALDEIRARNARNQKVAPEKLIESLYQPPSTGLEDEASLAIDEQDTAAAKAAFVTAEGQAVRRVAPSLVESSALLNNDAKRSLVHNFASSVPTKRKASASALGIVVKKESLV